MGLFDFLKGKNALPKNSIKEPPIPESEKQYYRPDTYYTDSSYPGTQFEQKVITFEERKKSSYPSRSGLYVAEILLLEYVSYGTYPHPKNGYPGFWWFEYGIRNVGAALKSLEERGYIEYASTAYNLSKMTVAELKELASNFSVKVSGKKADIVSKILENVPSDQLESAVIEQKYCLTEKGKAELQENEYVPYMHKYSQKTIEDGMFGPELNVWSVNRRVGTGEDWAQVIKDIEHSISDYREQKKVLEAPLKKELAAKDPEYAKLIEKIDLQDAQIESILAAEASYEKDSNIDVLISFWADIWENGGLLFNGSKWTFRLPDLYIQQKRYDDAIRILSLIKDPAYKDKKESYLLKVQSKKEKTKKS